MRTRYWLFLVSSYDIADAYQNHTNQKQQVEWSAGSVIGNKADEKGYERKDFYSKTKYL